MVDLRQLLTSRTPSPGVRLLRWGLRLVSLPYHAAVVVKNLSYDWGWKKPFRSRLPVVSVGNLSVGGTGKSPTVAWLARWLRRRGLRVAILSRGYGQLDSGQNDEALELELQLPDVPHLQHWDRVVSAKLADEELQMQLLLLDDGFQHRRMARDLEIVLLDATDPPAARWLLPGGLLREPLSSLKRADIVVLTRSDQATPGELTAIDSMVRKKTRRAAVLRACHRPSHLMVFPDVQRDLDELRDRQVLAFCAIGNPQSFFGTLANLGATVVDERTWPDHHGFDASDVQTLEQWSQQFPEAEMLVCTVKDWVKFQTARIGGLELVAVAVELDVLEGLPELEQALIACCEQTGEATVSP